MCQLCPSVTVAVVVHQSTCCKKGDKVWKILYFNFKTYNITRTNYSRLTDNNTFLYHKKFLCYLLN